LNFNPLTILLASFAPIVCLIAAILLDRERRKKTEKPPQSEKLLRPPGYSLSIRLDENADKLLDDLLASCGLSAIAGIAAWFFGVLFFNHAPFLWIAVCTLVLTLFLIASGLSAIRAFRRYQAAQNIRLGLRGEQAVAEALNEAAEFGFRSFHDLPAEETWNIDHVVVGTRGVFLIETKTYRRRGSKTAQAAHEVIYSGEFLQFPMFKTNKPIEQAKRNAKWLSNYLRNKTGEPVEVFPLVVLPGWFVKIPQKGNFGVNVVNANYLPGFLQRQTEKIELSQVRRIITALDEKCRTVEF
jgi:hypothetical protein